MGLFVLNQEIFAADSGNRSLLLMDRPLEATPDTGTTQRQLASSTSQLSKAQSAKKAGNHTLAISIFKEIVMLEPNNLEVRVALAATLAEAEMLDEARSQLDIIQKIRPSWVQAYLARAQLEQQARNEVSALKAFNQALVIEPGNRIAREGRVLTLSRLGSPGIALAEAKRYPDMDRGIIQRLHEDEAAHAIRRSENVYHENPATAIPAADAAIEMIKANLQRYPGSERSRFDYVRALTNRNHHRDAIAVYETLIKENRAVPGYTHQSAGLSYLAEQLPEHAKTAFVAALTADPNDYSASVGLFYALCDLTDFSQAKMHIDALAARPLDPEKKFETEMLAVWVNAYADHLGIAQNQFLTLQTRAPASTALHNALARIYLWRGWPRRAGEKFNLVAQQSPHDREAQAGLTDVEMALGDFRSAARRVAHLNTLSADDATIKKLNRSQALHLHPELRIVVGSSQNKERTSTGQSLHLDTRIYSTPINSQNRLFAHQYYESTRFNAGSAYYKRLGLGWESVIARVAKLEIEIQQEFFKDNHTGILLGSEIQLNDYWRIKGRYDSNSIDVPLRARVNDIGGESVYLGGGFRLNERAAFDIGIQQLSMSDSNHRRSLSATGEYQFIQGPFYKAAAALDISSSTNTLVNTAYFNPARDHTVQLTLKNEWLGYRRYARSFYQRFYFSAGEYAQQNFSTQPIGSVRYEHEWNFSDALNTRYGLAYVRRAFDGEPSTGPEATLSVNWKF